MSTEQLPAARIEVQVIESEVMPGLHPSQSLSQIGSGAPGTPLDSLKELEKIQEVKEGMGAGVWHNNKRVNSQWTKAETRNGWLGLTDLGWKKIFSGSDTAVTAIAMLGAQALEKQSPVNVLIENDQIIEIYVW